MTVSSDTTNKLNTTKLPLLTLFSLSLLLEKNILRLKKNPSSESFFYNRAVELPPWIMSWRTNELWDH